jgi:hypothetical protein
MPNQKRAISCSFRRAVGLEAREVDNEFFVVVLKTETIHHLDRMASAAWRTLETPKTATEMINLFHAAFPRIMRRKIETDLVNLLDLLEESGLIIKTSCGSDSMRDSQRKRTHSKSHKIASHNVDTRRPKTKAIRKRRSPKQ